MTSLRTYAEAATVLLAQSTLLLLGVFLVARQLRGKGPAATSLVCKAGLIGIAALFAIPFIPLHRSRSLIQVPAPPQVAVLAQPAVMPVAPSRPVVAPARSEAPVSSESASPAFALGHVVDTPPAKGAPLARLTWADAVMGLWALGTAWLLLWIVWAQVTLASLRRRSTHLTSGLAFDRLQQLSRERGLKAPELRVHPAASRPFLAGIRRPAILIDSAVAGGLDATSLDLIFEHELAHVKTKDCAWRLAERVVCALLWPQPLLWRLCSRLDQFSEEFCDQVVIANSPSRRQYADCLLALANGTQGGRTGHPLAVGMAPFRSSIGRRIAKIMDASQRISTKLSRKTRFGIAGVTSILAIATVMAVSGSMPLRSQDTTFGSASDPAAVTLLEQTQQAYKDLNTLSESVQFARGNSHGLMEIDFKRPGRAVVQQLDESTKTVQSISYIDPDGSVAYLPASHKFMRALRAVDDGKPLPWGSGGIRPHIQDADKISMLATSQMPLFLKDGSLPKTFKGGTLSAGPDWVKNGEALNTLILKLDTPLASGGTAESTVTFSVSKQDHLLRKVEVVQHRPDQDALNSVATYDHIRVNPNLSDGEFTFHAPAGAVEIQPYGSHKLGPGVQALMTEITEAYRDLHSLSFEARGDRGHLFVALQKPNLAQLSLKMSWGGKEHNYMDSVCDGKEEYVWPSPAKRYLTYPADSEAVGRFGGGGMAEQEFEGLLGSVGFALSGEPLYFLRGDLTLGPSRVVNGVPVDSIISSVSVSDESGKLLTDSYSRHEYLFSKANHLLVEVLNHNHSVHGGKVWDRQESETVVHLDVDKTPGVDFKFNPGSMTPANSWKQVSPIYDADTNIHVGDSFPAFSANDLQGKPFSLDQYRGKVLLIHAWTQGVENCETDLPKIESLYRKYRRQGFDVVGIACDGRSSTEAFLKKKGVVTRQLWDGQGVTKGFKDKLHIRLFPFVYLIGRDGKVLAKNPWIPDLEPTLKKALASGGS